MKVFTNILMGMMVYTTIMFTMPLYAEEDWSDWGEASAATAEKLEWSGYYENQLMVFTLPGYYSNPDGIGADLLDYNKLRLDLTIKPQKGFKVEADIVLRTYHGATVYNLSDMLPDRFQSELQVIQALDPQYTQYTLEHEIYLDNAYFSANLGNIRLNIGKQQIRFGSGWFWNPTDPFNTKDLLDPSYEKTGVTAFNLQYFFLNEGLFELYVLPIATIDHFRVEDTSLAARLRKAWGQWVVALNYTYKPEVIGLESPLTFEPLEQKRHLLGLEVTGEIEGLGIWFEGAFNYVNYDLATDQITFGNPTCSSDVQGICWFEAVVGANYTFRGGVVAQIEYLFNGRGYGSSDEYQLIDWFAYYEQKLRYMGQHYISAYLQVPIESAHININLSGIMNLSDQSMLISPWLNYQWNQYLSLDAYVALTWGDDTTDEFYTMGRAGYIRFRFSF